MRNFGLQLLSTVIVTAVTLVGISVGSAIAESVGKAISGRTEEK